MAVSLETHQQSDALIAASLALAASFAASPGDALPAAPLADATGATAVLAPGPVRVVNLWASWCGPCRAELPLLDSLQGRLGQEAEVVFVSVDTSRPRAQALVKHLDLTARVLFDGESFAAAVQPDTLPTTLLVDANGIVRRVYTGAIDVEALAALEADVRALVPVPSASAAPELTTP